MTQAALDRASFRLSRAAVRLAHQGGGAAGIAFVAVAGYAAPGEASCTYSYGQYYGSCSGPSLYEELIAESPERQGELAAALAIFNLRAEYSRYLQRLVSRRTVGRAGGYAGLDWSDQKGIAAGDEGMTFSVWAEGSAARLTTFSNAPSGSSKGTNNGLVLGADVRNDRFMVGLSTSLQSFRADLNDLDGQAEIRSIGITPYAAYNITPSVIVSALFTYSKVETEQSLFENAIIPANRTDGTWTADRFGGTVGLTGFHTLGAVTLTGTTGVTYAREAAESYTNSQGQTVSPGNTVFGQWELGGEASYQIGAFQPYLGATLGYEFDGSSTTSFKSNSVVNSEGTIDVLYRLGTRVALGQSITGNLEFSTVQHRPTERTTSVLANLQVLF